MSPEKFEKINGHEPFTGKSEKFAKSYAICVCKCSGTATTLAATGPFLKEGEALKALSDVVLKHHGKIVMERQGWKCTCGKATWLSAHHKIFRSHERDDRVTNLLAQCNVCHRDQHA